MPEVVLWPPNERLVYLSKSCDRCRTVRRRIRERHMTYLSNAANKRPMFRLAAGIVLAFCCAIPLAWLISHLVIRG